MQPIAINDVPLIIVIPICCAFYGAFKFLRRKFSVAVNCWFCHANCRVPYDDWNSFTCPKCRQYNGFTQDGDYNKLIPEHYEELLNHIVTPVRPKTSSPSNGLCKRCNENQQLKVFQLTNFEPLDEDNYDQEIEHFEKQLEKSYVLCKKCTVTVKNKIYDVNCTLLAKQIEEIKRSGKTLLNHASNNKLLMNSVRRFALFVLLLICLAWAAPVHYKVTYFPFLWVYQWEIGFTAVVSIITSLLMYYFTCKVDAQKSQAMSNLIKAEESSAKKRKVVKIQSNGSLSVGTHPKFVPVSSNIPLNCTNYDNDSSDSSACSELARLSCHSPNHLSSKQEFATLKNLSGRENNSFVNSTFRSTSSPFFKASASPRPDINDAIGRLQLEKTSARFDGRKVVSPTRFRNPWTGKTWRQEVERSASQSSGIASRSTSICSDEFAEVACRMPSNVGLFFDSASTRSQGSIKYFNNPRQPYENSMYSKF